MSLNEEKIVKKTILIVDDNPDFTLFIKEILEENGFECLVSFSPIEALKQVKVAKPNLILLDLMLPGMSGHGFMCQLKNDVDTALIPVVALSALRDEDVIEEMLDLGVIEYLTKSCSVKRLISTLENSIAY